MSKHEGRDRQGRWLKGFSGNLKGRPGKFARVDHGDLMLFKNEAKEVQMPYGKVMMTREGAILHRLYQSAMKGNVHAQIYLARRFEQHKETMSSIAAEAQRIISELKENNWAPTDYEMDLIRAARMHLDPTLRDASDTAKPASRRRSRRKPKRRGRTSEAGSDP